MQVEMCPRCGKPVSVEVGTGFLCCLDCKLRLVGYSYWPDRGRPTNLQLFKNAADAQVAAGKSGDSCEVAAIWANLPD